MIHKFRMFGTYIVADVNSGSVHILDDLAYEILDYYPQKSSDEIKNILKEKYNGEDISEAIEEIDHLREEGQLFAEDTYEAYIKPLGNEQVVKALCLHVSHDCNLRCKYCFASTGDFGTGRMIMDADTGKKALDFLISKSGGRKNLEVDFFGGEPLMNFDVVKEIVKFGRKREKEAGKTFKFTITTNALMLNDENIKFINENMYNVVLSIDGRKTVNDKMRSRVDGSGSYDSVLEKIKKLVDARNGENYYVRGTFTRENLDFSKDVLHLADMGFKNISVEPVVANKDSGYDLREEDLPFLFEEYEKLAHQYIERNKLGKGFNFFHFMLDLSQGPCIAKRLSGCGSGHEYLAITPEGDIYPCHQFVGMENYKMGNLNEGTLNSEVQNGFRDSNVYTKSECKNCWAKFYCSGGCAANSLQFNGTINSAYFVGCELERKRMECALWIQSQLNMDT